MRQRGIVSWRAVAVILSLLLAGNLLAALLSGCYGGWTKPDRNRGFAFIIQRRPDPWVWSRGELPALPSYDPASVDAFQVDLRGYDLSDLDLTGRLTDLFAADFDSRTVWPADLPSSFDPDLIMELGKSPGLGLRELHERGITGEGVGLAILDQPLIIDHVEYGDQLRHYEEYAVSNPMVLMHGPAVASIAVGKTVGVAPGADLYYIATNGSRVGGTAPDAIERFLAMNRFLPPEGRIRVISISMGLRPTSRLSQLVTQAAAEGVLVISCDANWSHGLPIRYHGLERDPLATPEDYRSYHPVTGWGYFAATYSPEPPRTILFVPMNSRCVAGHTGPNDYAFYRSGGFSWCAPYIGGLYALACQVDPDMDPQTFYDAALATGRPIDTLNLEPGTRAVVVDPAGLIEALEAGD